MGDPILPGAEPQSWVGGAHGRNGALVLHGFTGSPQSMRALAQVLADSGLEVELPLLPGHGTAIEDLIPSRWERWAEAAETAYVQLEARCNQVLVVGLSMGGTLACWLATRHPEVAGIVVINPFVEPPAPSFDDILEGLLAAGYEVAPKIGADIADPEASELSYPGTPIRAAQSLFAATATLDLARITCPVLAFHSRHDHVVPPSSGDLLERVSGPLERIWLERSYHVATLDYDRAEIEARVVAFAMNMLS